MRNGDRTGNDEGPTLEFVEIYRSGFRATPEAVGVLAADGEVVDINASAERLLLSQRASVLGRTTAELGWWVDPDEREACREEVLRTGTLVRPVRLRRGDGAVRDAFVSATRVEVSGQSFVFWIGRDVTGQPLSEEEATRLSEALGEATAEKRRLVLRLVHAAEYERARVADRLRAGPIQRLTASQLSLEAFQAGRGTSAPDALGRIGAGISDAIADLRRLSIELRPPALERDGLGAAVRALLREFEETYGLRADLDDRAAGGSMSSDSSVLAYRVIFDALIGVRDRGSAGPVAVSLEVSGTDLTVAIHVEGMPMRDEHPLTHEALGLETIHDLLSSIGGSVEITVAGPDMTITSIVPMTMA